MVRRRAHELHSVAVAVALLLSLASGGTDAALSSPCSGSCLESGLTGRYRFDPVSGLCICVPFGLDYALALGSNGSTVVRNPGSNTPVLCPTWRRFTCAAGACCYRSDSNSSAAACGATVTSDAQCPCSGDCNIYGSTSATPIAYGSEVKPPTGPNSCTCLEDGHTWALPFTGTGYVTDPDGSPQTCPIETPFTCATGACCYASKSAAIALTCPSSTTAQCPRTAAQRALQQPPGPPSPPSAAYAAVAPRALAQLVAGALVAVLALHTML